MLVVGLISGTSVDGVDAVLVNVSGVPPRLNWQLLEFVSVPFASEIRDRVFTAFNPETSRVDELCQLNVKLGQVFAQASLQVIEKAGLSPRQVDLIGSHGQTVWHHPTGSEPSTLQLGEAAVIAELTGIPVISNFRARDMAVGGQGAPLVAYADVLLATDPEKTRAVQNIGGIGNVTYLPALNDPLSTPFAFDTGPGNMVIDAAVSRWTKGSHTFDPQGQFAAQGRIHPELLIELLRDPYLRQPPPKTTGREYYGSSFFEVCWRRAEALALSPVDLIATLTQFTAKSIEQAYRSFLPPMPDEVIVGGGGSHNLTLMLWLQTLLDPIPVLTSDYIGILPDAKEAIAFALLAYETWHQRPGNLSTATGASRPVILGQLTPGRPRTSPDPSVDIVGGTEGRNPATATIDTLTTVEMVRVINAEDAQVAAAVGQECHAIAAAIDEIAARMQQGGRLIYIGAGTSGRLGVLDAAECPPTFSTDPGQVIGVIAGGARAITQAVEGAEDSPAAGAAALKNLAIAPWDSVVGIAASGSTPFVLGGMTYARDQGSLVIGLACNRPCALEKAADISILPLVGPEVILGSTRLKAGTAQKLVLNLLSTGVMVRLGKTFGNLMVDLQPTNAKLKRRAHRMVELACDISAEEAERILGSCQGNVKAAILSFHAHLSPERSWHYLQEAQGILAVAFETLGIQVSYRKS